MRMELKRNVLDSALEQVNRYFLQMSYNFPSFREALVKAHGMQDGGSFISEYRPADFLVDGKMWTENEVYLDTASYIDRQAERIGRIQDVQNKLMSRRRAMQLSRDVPDATRETRQIEKETQADMQLVAEANATANANPQTDVGEPAQTAQQLERGSIGAAPPMQMPGGTPVPPGMAAAPETGEPGGAPDPEVMDLLQTIASTPKLKGRVWVGGTILQGNKDMGVDIYLDNMADKATIVAWVAKKDPKWHGKLIFLPAPAPPEEQAIELTGGGSLGPEAQAPPEAFLQEAPTG
jgi:hypothetical protein